ncbi:MAG: hypothetical protein J5U16_02940, partial [Candidatus Methanoperedens sp.]|nr:hypothetical protein [Candidatus Methanoperedens sp.]
MKTATILLKKEEQSEIKDKVTEVLENYDNFVLVEVTDKQITSLKKEGFKVVVRSEIDNIQLGHVNINTANLRSNEGGAITSQPAYEHAKDPDSGMHHYIDQFIGPVKEEWKEEIKRLGGILCDPLPSFAYIVEMDGQTRDELLKQSFIRGVGHYEDSYRLSPELLEEVKVIQSARSMGRAPLKAGEAADKPTLSKKAPATPNAFSVSFHTRQNLDEARTNIVALGADISGDSESGKIITVTFPPDTSRIPD